MKYFFDSSAIVKRYITEIGSAVMIPLADGLFQTPKCTFQRLEQFPLYYQEVQADKQGMLRKVWLFEFRIHKQPDVIPIDQAIA